VSIRADTELSEGHRDFVRDAGDMLRPVDEQTEVPQSGVVMDRSTFDAMEQRLRADRDHLREKVASTAGELETLEERRRERWTRLDQRTKQAIADIDAALIRLADHQYGRCLRCGRSIAIARLQIPATRFCLRCARRQPRSAETIPSAAVNKGVPDE
jgi:DnaK suppressor protein